MRGLQGTEHILPGTDAWIDEAAGLEFGEGAPIETITLALALGAERPPAIGTLLPPKTEPPKVLGCGGDEVRLAARPVEVFVAQDQQTVVLLSPPLSGPEGSRMAQVEPARGRRREPAAIGPRTSLRRRYHGMFLPRKAGGEAIQFGFSASSFSSGSCYNRAVVSDRRPSWSEIPQRVQRSQQARLPQVEAALPPTECPRRAETRGVATMLRCSGKLTRRASCCRLRRRGG